MLKYVIVSLGMLTIALPLAASPVGASERTQSTLDRFTRTYLEDACRIGVSVAARIDGKTYFSNQGSTSWARRRRPTPDSVYELASVTKTFAGATAARAVTEGRLTLDEDFRPYLPGIYPNLIRSGRPVTLRDLATHSSGLQRDLPDTDALFAKPDYDRLGAQLTQLNKGYTRAKSLSDLRAVELRTTPGAEFAYSNLGIRVLGYGLETVYREPFDQLLRRSILAPLHMSSTGFLLSPTMRARSVTPYNRHRRAQPFHDSSAGAAYGLFSTPRDMARYLAWQLDERDPVVTRAHSILRGTIEDGQGLIWNIGRDGGRRMLWHGGGTFGETSQMVLFPDAGEGFVLLANDSCEGSEAALKALAISIHAALHNEARPPGTGD